MKTEQDGLFQAEDGGSRCFWCAGAAEMVPYHDSEWGFPVSDDQRLFEKISLEGFQAGLSWLTILRKREAFRRAFAGFDIERVARFDERDVRRLLDDAGIVRHRGKIEAVINNAARAGEMIEVAGSLAAWLWRFEPDAKSRPRRLTREALAKLTSTPASTALSKELRRREWKFVGPTTMYAFMQAMGLVDDHLEGCVVRPRAEAARQKFVRPT